MRSHSRSRSVLSASLLLALAGCGDAVGPDGSISGLPRSLTHAEESVLAASNAFGLELIREVVARDEGPNVVLSPLSASMALGMTMNGAAGRTFEAMRSTLGFGDLSLEEIDDAYRGLMDLLPGLDPEVEFRIANSVWATQDVTFRDAFFQDVTRAFDAQVEARDFRSPATLDEINGWVDDRTRGKIPRILDALDPDLVMFLLNAIYFDGTWTTRFDPDRTRPGDFFRADGSVAQVDMMSLGDVDLPMAGGPDFSAVELPYGGGAYAMTIVVPRPPADAWTFVAGLDEARWASLLEGLAPHKVDLVSIPRLKLSYDGLLNEPLKAMGMDVAFHDGADFTRMSPQGDRFCISFVRQKTFLEVDEAGTRAAAATGVGVGVTSFHGIIADRPFFFAIRERFSGAILFAGVIGDPTVAESKPGPVSTDCS